MNTARVQTWEEAASTGDVAALERLLAAGADIDALDEHGQTALMLAALEGHERAVAFLAQRGANLNHTAKYRLSALMLAVIRGHRWVAQALVNAGADRSIKGSAAPGFEGKSFMTSVPNRVMSHANACAMTSMKKLVTASKVGSPPL